MQTAPDLFARYFLPLYPVEEREDLHRARAVDANPGGNPQILAHLRDAAERFRERAAMLARDLDLDFSDASVHRLSHALTPERFAEWAGSGAMGTADSELFNIVVHGAAYVGECIVRTRGKEGGAENARWLVRRPLWESRVYLRSPAGEAELAPFSWMLRAAEGNAVASLADRYHAFVEVPSTDAREWPVWCVPRPLPRMAHPTYSQFYKYLRAHLVEIRDVGSDFPSPERFAEFRFRWLALTIVGEGRAVVAYGQGAHGLSAFWFTEAGFLRALFIPCDTGGESEVTFEGERIRFSVVVEGKRVFQETLWWGP